MRPFQRFRGFYQSCTRNLDPDQQRLSYTDVDCRLLCVAEVFFRLKPRDFWQAPRMHSVTCLEMQASHPVGAQETSNFQIGPAIFPSHASALASRKEDRRWNELDTASKGTTPATSPLKILEFCNRRYKNKTSAALDDSMLETTRFREGMYG